MSIAKMKMLKWMRGHTIEDKIRNEIISNKVGMTLIEAFMRWKKVLTEEMAMGWDGWRCKIHIAGPIQ